MLNILKSCLRQKNQTANIIDGKLILSFPEAETPVLWQMDLENAKISALEIQTKGEEGHAVLVLKNPKGETISIATFTNQNDAVENLIKISNALGQAHGKIQKQSANENNPNAVTNKGGWLKKIGLTLLVLVGLFFLLGIIGSLMTPTTAQNGAPVTAQDGQPMSADDFLKGY